MSSGLMQSGLQSSGMQPFGGDEYAGSSPANEIGQRFMLAHQIAGALMYATLIPDHLRGERKNVSGNWQMVAFSENQIRANCMMVVNRALQWGVDPVALISESFVVGGKLDFQGKVIIAVVNKLGGLRTNLKFEYHGEGDQLTVVVTGTLKSETEPRTIELRYKDAVTKDKGGKVNEQWTKDVESKLAYSGAKKWARRHTPEVVLGLFSEEDDSEPAVITVTAKAIETTPAKTWPDTLVGGYEQRIAEAPDRGALARLVDKIKSEPAALLTSEEGQYLISMAKMVWKRKPVAEGEDVPAVQESAPAPVERQAEPVSQDPEVEPLLDEKVMHYEAMIQEVETPESLEKLIHAIDGDQHLPIAMKKSLGKLANVRQREGFAVAK